MCRVLHVPASRSLSSGETLAANCWQREPMLWHGALDWWYVLLFSLTSTVADL
jgi:hypothetical protein